MRDGNNEIYVMNADGSGQTRLTNQPELDGQPRWSPDGSRIAFLSLRDGNSEIYLMNADGSDPVNLTNSPANEDNPAWSPDGALLGFDSDRDGHWEFYTMRPDGSAQTRLTENNNYYGFAAWAPDGVYIAYTAGTQGDLHIDVMTYLGSRVTTLIKGQGDDFEPQWSAGHVPGIYADPITLPTAKVVSTPAPLFTPSSATPGTTGACGVQDGSWSAWSGTELNVLVTIANCRITMIYMIGTVDGQWIILSHYLDEPINGPDFSFVYAFDEQNKYELSGKFTSPTTADMHIIYFAPFHFTDTFIITEDLEFDLTATVE
jgi:hypothetical protein